MSVYSNLATSTPDDIARYVAALLNLLGNRNPVAVLRETPDSMERFIKTVPAHLVTLPEAPGKWSIGEVVAHLADSELVGGFRLRMVLAHDRPHLTGYDQDLWASRLRYRDVAVRDALEQFSVLRRANMRIWERLGPSDLARVGLHGERGEESLGHIRNLYAGHDLLHLRQVERIRAAQTVH
jgi:hypothetical protein